MINTNQIRPTFQSQNYPKSEEQIYIQLERMKSDDFKQKRQQLESNFLRLKHNNQECMNLVTKISLNPFYQSSNELVNSKADSIDDALQRYQSVKLANSNSQIFNFQTEKQLHQYQNIQINVDLSLRSLQLTHQHLSSKLSFYQQEYRSLKEKLSSINQQVNKRQRVEQLSDRVAELIEMINDILPNHLSLQEIQMLLKFDFNSFNACSNQEIIYRKHQVNGLKYTLLQMSFRYSRILEQLKGIGEVENELEGNLFMNGRLNQRVSEIMLGNDSLEMNMAQEVERIVNEKMGLINFDSYSHVNKYVQATEYLLQKFGGILEKEEFDETVREIRDLKLSAEKKYQMRY